MSHDVIESDWVSQSNEATRPLAIVVVDDDVIHLRLIERLFRRTPHRVVTAESIDAVESSMGAADVVFIDYRLRGASGLDAAEHVREQNHQARICLWSSAELPGDVRNIAANGGIDVQEKSMLRDRQAFLDYCQSGS